MSFFNKYYSEAVTIRFVSTENEDEYCEFIIDPTDRSTWVNSKPNDISEEEEKEVYEKMSKIENILIGD
tara:strand:- start:1001 stop:1207 length:207 start_codon:yes stop_codon:yes gene_type:complete